VQVHDAKPAPGQDLAFQQRGAEHRDQVRAGLVDQAQQIGVIDVRHQAHQLRPLDRRCRVAEEERRLAAAGVAAPVAQPAPGLVPEPPRPELLLQLLPAPLAARLVHDRDHVGRAAEPVRDVQVPR